MLQELVTLNIFAFILIFVRVGTMFLLLPGFSASYVSRRVRLTVALAISFLMVPVLAPDLPAPPSTYMGLVSLLIMEVVVGAFLGAIARILMAALQTAGTLLAFFSSLANALVQDPIAVQQSSVFSNFLSITGITLVFVTGLHHLMLEAVMSSYTLFPAGGVPPLEDFAQFISRKVADSFALGLRLCMPFVIIAFIYYLGLGILGRLMPQFPVFFVGLPLQVGVQLWIFAVTLSGIMLVFMNNFRSVYEPFIIG